MGKAQILERQMTQSLNGLANLNLAVFDLLQ